MVAVQLLAIYSHGFFAPPISVTDFFRKILEIGTTQHFALVEGDFLKELSILAELMEFEYYSI